MTVKGYELIGEWKVSNIGYTVQAKKGGKVYFLKRYGEYKMPRHDDSTSEALYNRLKTEFESFKANRIKINEALSSLAGPGGNIILPTDWFVDDIYYIEATEFVERLIEDEAILRLSKADKLFVMLTAAGALHNIHRKNIIHSDLKRTNILAARNTAGKTVAKIIDFDRSYFADNVRADELGGDQAFMSPELAQCFMYDMAEEALALLTTKSDIFSLGLVFHDYLADGEHPKIVGLTGKLKDRADEGKTVYCSEALLSDAQLIVSKKIDEKYLSHLIAAMIQLEPEDRPTAQEVLEILKTKRVLPLKEGSIKIDGEESSAAAATSAGRTATPVPDRTPTPAPAPTPERRVPTGFCAPWEGHNIKFNETVLNAAGYVASEKTDKKGTKCYQLYKRDGSARVFTIENLVILGLATREGGTKTPPARPVEAPRAAEASDIKVFDDGTLWETESGYVFDLERVNSSGYKGVARAQKKDVKGYVLIKASGEKRFVLFNQLKMLGFAAAK